MWSEKPYRYEHLRVFRYVANGHRKKNDKLKPLALKWIFVGYLKGVKEDINCGLMNRENRNA